MDSEQPTSPSPTLSVGEFHELQRLFNQVAGLRFDASALPLFQRRLASRLPLHDLDNYRDYLSLLQAGLQSSDEMSAALDLLTAGETYFFRHKEQLALFADTILPTIAETNSMSRRL